MNGNFYEFWEILGIVLFGYFEEGQQEVRVYTRIGI
jgi:hypothetical protein